jgi:kynureninase
MSILSKSDEHKALLLDKQDPLKDFKSYFSLPEDTLYFCHNSLGLPTKSTSTAMQQHLHQWSHLGVEGWFKGKDNWYTSIDLALRQPLSSLLGADPSEVVVMNSLTTNLHLLLTSFYQPTSTRYKILIEAPCFPSDLYAIKSHLLLHRLDPSDALILVEPDEHTLVREETIHTLLKQQGHQIALVFLSSVNFLTGQLLNMASLTALAKQQGCIVGYDVAHAAGNIPLKLHDWHVDFAVGCSYKYLCSGPGGPGIAYVHTSHHGGKFPRLSGWWGNDPDKRFHMHLEQNFIPYGGARSWQVSTPSILSMIPLVESLKLFEKAHIEHLRKKSLLQTTFLLELLDQFPSYHFSVLTPRDIEKRGSQISLMIHHQANTFLQTLEKQGVICDFRPPNIIRITPSAFYTSFLDIYECVKRLENALKKCQENTDN